jgi:hypothetical protein
MRPLGSTWKSWPRQKTARPKKLATNTAKDKTSRTGSSQSWAVVRPSAPAIALAEAHLSNREITRKIDAVKPNPVATTPSAAIATAWVRTDPVWPAGVIVRTVRAQRNS